MTMLKRLSTEMKETCNSVSILDLPYVPLLKVFSFLDIHDLRNVALTCKAFNSLSREPELWRQLFPVRWSIGDIDSDDSSFVTRMKAHAPNLANRQWQVGPTMHMQTLWDIVQYHVLTGMLEHLLPAVGGGVRVLNLNNSSCLDDTLLRAMVVHCPNLMTLAISATHISPNAFSRLSVYGSCRQLLHLDMSLTKTNATTLTSLIECWQDCDEDKLLSAETQVEENPVEVFYISGNEYAVRPGENKNAIWRQANQFETTVKYLREDQIKKIPFPRVLPRRIGKCRGLTTLNLSGCPLNDAALDVMKNSRTLVENLEWLDVSGCYNLTSEAIRSFVMSCPRLLPENLFYCNNIPNGPYPIEFSGCSQLSKKHCCDLYAY